MDWIRFLRAFLYEQCFYSSTLLNILIVSYKHSDFAKTATNQISPLGTKSKDQITRSFYLNLCNLDGKYDLCIQLIIQPTPNVLIIDLAQRHLRLHA